MQKKLLLIAGAILLTLVLLPILGLVQIRKHYPEATRKGEWVQGGTNMMKMSESSVGVDSIAMDEMARPQAMPIAPGMGYEDFTPTEERTIIRNASLSLLATNTRQLVDKIKGVSNEFQGTVTNSSIYEDEYSKNVFANMTLRVPSEQLDAALEKIKSLSAKVVSENMSSSDETERKIDMEAQLSNLRATEAQFLTILEKASTVEETLKVQRELSNLRNQIERMEAQLENLEGAASMSTIYISISTQESELPVLDPNEKGLLEEIKLAFGDMVNLYRNLSVAGIRLVILGLPLIVVAAIAYPLLKSRRKK